MKTTIYDLANSKSAPLLVTQIMLVMQENLIELESKLEELEGIASSLAVYLECLSMEPGNKDWLMMADKSLHIYGELMDEWYPEDRIIPLGKE